MMKSLALALASSCSVLTVGCASARFDRDGHEYNVVVKDRTHSGLDLEILLRYALTDAQVPELSRVWREHAHSYCSGRFRGNPSPIYKMVEVDGMDDNGVPTHSSHGYVTSVAGHVVCGQ